jgi:hypothetical protein
MKRGEVGMLYFVVFHGSERTTACSYLATTVIIPSFDAKTKE